jgi:hypothetical protein
MIDIRKELQERMEALNKEKIESPGNGDPPPSETIRALITRRQEDIGGTCARSNR